jgi:uncharacterized protein YecT (DUF1311 family)
MFKLSLRRLILLSFLIHFSGIIPTTVSAEDDEKHPIERKMDDCMEKYSSTTGMKKCATNAEEQWNIELNRVYNLLLGKLDEDGKMRLKTAQLFWMKHRDAEFEAIHSIYMAVEREMGEGTLWKLAPFIAKVELVKNRVLELTHYLDDFSPENKE